MTKFGVEKRDCYPSISFIIRTTSLKNNKTFGNSEFNGLNGLSDELREKISSTFAFHSH